MAHYYISRIRPGWVATPPPDTQPQVRILLGVLFCGGPVQLLLLHKPWLSLGRTLPNTAIVLPFEGTFCRAWGVLPWPLVARTNANGHERQDARTSGVALSKSVAVHDGAIPHVRCINTYPKSLMQGSLWPRLLRTATRGPRNPLLTALHRR